MDPETRELLLKIYNRQKEHTEWSKVMLSHLREKFTDHEALDNRRFQEVSDGIRRLSGRVWAMVTIWITILVGIVGVVLFK